MLINLQFGVDLQPQMYYNKGVKELTNERMMCMVQIKDIKIKNPEEVKFCLRAMMEGFHTGIVQGLYKNIEPKYNYLKQNKNVLEGLEDATVEDLKGYANTIKDMEQQYIEIVHNEETYSEEQFQEATENMCNLYSVYFTVKDHLGVE